MGLKIERNTARFQTQLSREEYTSPTSSLLSALPTAPTTREQTPNPYVHIITVILLSSRTRSENADSFPVYQAGTEITISALLPGVTSFHAFPHPSQMPMKNPARSWITRPTTGLQPIISDYRPWRRHGRGDRENAVLELGVSGIISNMSAELTKAGVRRTIHPRTTSHLRGRKIQLPIIAHPRYCTNHPPSQPKIRSPSAFWNPSRRCRSRGRANRPATCTRRGCN